MKNLIIKSLSMRNFRGEFNRTTEFSPYETTISGANGLGKSRHFDAFLWLLFGKDSQDRKDYEIKTKNESGKTTDKVNVEVSALMEINGSTNELKRILVEDWVKPRGQNEEIYKGNHHELFWNDVPLKVSEFDSRVAGIIDAAVFKMITNPMFFTSMKWQDQREQLFQLAGTISDHEIASSKPEYLALLDKISGKSLSDYKKEISAKRKRLKEELETIQPRIDQTQKLMPEVKDWNAIETEISKLDTELKQIESVISDKSKAQQQHFEELMQLQKEINSIENQKMKLVNDFKMKASDEQFKAGSERRELEREITEKRRIVFENNQSIKNIENQISSLQVKIDEKRNQFKIESAKEFSGTDNCSHCGQLLPEEKKASARSIFAEAKKKTIEEINTSGVALKSQIEKLESDKMTVLLTISNLIKEVENLSEKLIKLPKLEEESKEVDASTIPGYSELESKIKSIENEIVSKKGKKDEDASNELSDKKSEIKLQLDTFKMSLNDKNIIERHKKEIIELTETAKNMAQQIADIEKDEFTITNFTKTKIEEAEKRVNGLFSFVKFQLFDYTIEGNESETCIPLINGVPFGAANTASKIMAGLDIIKVLQQFHGAYFPIFCDNAESVNQYPNMDNQMIYLKVTTEESLTVSYENQFVNN